MIKHLDIIVSGKVQGVFFRASTKAVADQLGIRGNVRNMPDGAVSIQAEANDTLLDMFLEWCHEGPENAEVDNVSSCEGEVKNYRNFEVLKR